MRIAFYGSSLLSSYWNGAATYYRGILTALSRLGYETTFYEPDAFERQAHRDIDPPPWARVEVYPATTEGVRQVRGTSTNQVPGASLSLMTGGPGDPLVSSALFATRERL